jgi:hypothetical protein
MNQTDYEKFLEELERTAEAFGVKLTPSRTATYFDDLRDLPLDAVISALANSRRTLSFFPKIAELRGFAAGSSADNAELAWRTLISLCSEGEYPSLQMYDRAMAYAIDCFGGWIATINELREASAEMLASFEKRFKASYRVASERPSAVNPPGYFCGSLEAENRRNQAVMLAWAGRSGAAAIHLPVCAVTTTGYVSLRIAFDPQSMRIEANAEAALAAGGEALKAYLPTLPPVLPQLPASEDSEPISEFEKKQILAEMRRLIKPMPAAELEEPGDVVDIAAGGTPWD